MRALGLLKKCKTWSGFLFLGGALLSCSSTQRVKPLFPLVSRKEREELKRKILSLWDQAEHERLLGDELSARVSEHEALSLESELYRLGSESSSLSKNSLSSKP